MNFNILDIEPDQITIELDNGDCYSPKEPVSLLLNGEKLGEYDINVITIDGLCPESGYELTVIENNTVKCSKTFTTARESYRLDVRKFGAKGDGISNDTQYIQAAILACPKEGTVYLGKGIYRSGPLFLKSDIRIKIDEGAVLLGDTDRNDYPVLPGMIASTDEKAEYNLGTWEGNPLDTYASLITGIGVRNVSIYGKGIVDGNASNADWWKDAKIRRGAWRPKLIYLNDCKGITIEGLKVCNSPCWTIHPYYSEDISLLKLTIRNPDDSPNTDGIDPESCKNVNIIGTDISVGDDCIAIKSGKYYMALRHYKTTEHVVVRNCRLNHGHGSVTIGSECAGGVKEVHVTGCIFDSTDRGLRIKSRRGRGKRSILEDIVFENIVMKDVRMPFTINMFYFCDPDGHSEYCQCKEALPVDDMTPRIKSITARNIKCDGVDASLLTAYGLPEQKIELICLENIDAVYRPESERVPAVPVMMDGMEPVSGKGIMVRNVGLLRLNNIRTHGSTDKDVDADAVDNMECNNVSIG